MESPEHQARAVREYMELECPDEEIVHLEKVASERVFELRHDIWDVHTDKGRWWVITEPTNLYRQSDFVSMDQTLTFHLGLAARMHSRQQRPASEDEHARFLQTARQMDKAAQALDSADEAEEFQTVGMRCRECLLTLVREAATDRLMQTGSASPKMGDFVGWAQFIADRVFGGASSERLRNYAKSVGKSTWELVNWLTHARNAVRHDAEIIIGATDNVLGLYITAVRRWETGVPERCPHCGSYKLISDFRKELFHNDVDDPYVTLCEACGWESE